MPTNQFNNNSQKKKVFEANVEISRKRSCKISHKCKYRVKRFDGKLPSKFIETNRVSLVDSNYSVHSASGCISPDGRLNLFLITWNMCLQYPEQLLENLKKIIYPNSIKEHTCHLIVIMIQEICPNINKLKIGFQKLLGASYLLMQASTYLNNATFIFARREILFELSNYEVYRKFLGASQIPKGALLIKCCIGKSSFLFINAHLHEGIQNHEKRVMDYRSIIDYIFEINDIPDDSKSGSFGSELSELYDHIFLCGDLNTRLHNYENKIFHNLKLIENGIRRFEDLLVDDELIDAQTESQAFQIFDEGRINFPPTYKYDLNSTNFDTSYKQRLPAYTDRILFKSRLKNRIQCLVYDSCLDLITSDHRSVYGLFDIQLNFSQTKEDYHGRGQFDSKTYEAAMEEDDAIPSKNDKSDRI